MPALLSAAEAAEQLGLSARRVQELCEAGTIRAHRLGKHAWIIAPAELARYRRACSQPRKGRGRPRKAGASE